MEEDLEELLPSLMEDDRGFLDLLVVRAGEVAEEDLDEAVGVAGWECCGELALGMSTQHQEVK